MLTKRHLATIRAALLFWKEEIAVHNARIATPYLEDDTILPLEFNEVEQLRRCFQRVRYVAYDPQTDTLLSQEFLHDAPEQDLRKRGHEIATLILPA